MDLSYINPYNVIENLKKDNAELRAENAQLRTELAEEREKNDEPILE